MEFQFCGPYLSTSCLSFSSSPGLQWPLGHDDDLVPSDVFVVEEDGISARINDAWLACFDVLASTRKMKNSCVWLRGGYYLQTSQKLGRAFRERDRIDKRVVSEREGQGVYLYIYPHTLVDIASRALMKGPFSLVLHVKNAVGCFCNNVSTCHRSLSTTCLCCLAICQRPLFSQLSSNTNLSPIRSFLYCTSCLTSLTIFSPMNDMPSVF